uniref:dual-specificity kinase n=1 Tax=Oryza punctata TaxID=4537 RepID=A0A0E0JKL8_ORYPU
MESSRSRKRARQDWDGAGEPPPAAERAVVARGGASPPWRDDDRDGHYVFDLGENLNRRYKILSKMGEGTFGRVLECWDRETHEYVAIKVVRSIRKYRDAAMIEIDVLNRLAENERYRSLFKDDMHELRLIHTDLKPENILLVSSEYIRVPGSKKNSQDEMHFKCLPKSSAIKLIDFGSTAFDNQEHSSIVSTRHYRAPEIILGLGWSFPCDLWSVGCILVELCSGEALFQTHENLEHLAMMERVLGPLPEHMIRKASSSAQKYFRRGARLNWPEGAVSRESIRAVKKLDRLKDLVARKADHSRAVLADLLYGLLKFEPSERLTAQEALDHPFFRNTT